MNLPTNTPICILGMHRSGTSMIARMLHECGVYLGPMDDIMPATEYDNPEGYWENTQFVEINDDLLKAFGGTWNRPPELSPGWSDDPRVKPFFTRVEGALLGLDDKDLWGWKDPRTMLTIEFWRKAVPNARFQLCLRNPAEVAFSLERRPDWGALDYDASLSLWERYHSAVLQELNADQFIVTHYNSYLYNAPEELRRVLDAMGVKPSEESFQRAVQTIKPGLHRNLIAPQLLPKLDTPKSVVQQYLGLCRHAGPVFERMEADSRFKEEILEANVTRMFGDMRKLKGKIVELDNLIEAHKNEIRAHQDAISRVKEQNAKEQTILRQALEETRKENGKLLQNFDQQIKRRIAYADEQLEQHLAVFLETLSAQREIFQTKIANADALNQHLSRELGQAQRVVGLVRRFLPPNSTRFKLARTAFVTARTLKQSGVRGFSRKVAHRLRGRGPESLPAPSSDESQPDQLLCRVEGRIDCEIEYGQGTTWLLRGWCYHTNQKIATFQVLLGGKIIEVERHSTTRYDVLRQINPKLRGKGNALSSGFWCVIPLWPELIGSKCSVTGILTYEDGSTERFRLGYLEVRPEPVMNRDQASSGDSSPLVAICMTTYNPPEVLFRKQIDSLVSQSYKNWVCFINDDCSSPENRELIAKVLSRDPRFRLVLNEANLGVYRNFEACLRRVPEQADYVMLCDQDDCWDSNKIEMLVRQMEPGVSLAYSDMRTVDQDGNVISKTYWKGRRNNYRSLACMMLANTVTGASSIFTSRLLPSLLPFPDRQTNEFHDHWLACVALANGRLAYDPEPRYSYTQHGGNVIGHFKPRKHSLLKGLAAIRKWRKDSPVNRGRAESKLVQLAFASRWPLRIAYWSSELLARGITDPKKRAELKQLEHLHESPKHVLKLALRHLARSRAVIGLQWYSYSGILAQGILDRYAVENRTEVMAALRTLKRHERVATD